jgi:arginine/lysine/ornithine decarboxylase
MDQNRTPLIDAILAFEHRHVSYFNVPSHRAERGAGKKIRELLGDRVFAADLTETDGTDDLHAAEGPILEAQELAAQLFGSDECRFLVNGTTCGNEAMILASVREGEKILVARNAHKSAWAGLQLAGAVPVWLIPRYDRTFRVFCGIDAEEVERALASDPDIRAVFLASPTYYGVSSDLRAIADVCHRHHCALLVDEAHGTHFYFDRRFPAGAVAAGADLTAMSMHKTGGSLTQSSLLHRCGRRVDPDRLSDCLKMVQSSSPSYLLMASLDGARHDLAANGSKKMERAIRLADAARDGLLKIPGVRVLGGRDFRTEAGERQDPLRVVFSAISRGISGIALQEALFARNVTTEMADPCNVVAIVTDGNTEEDIRNLVSGVEAIVMKTGGGAGPAADPVGLTLPAFPADPVGPAVPVFPADPETVLTPRQAMNGETRQVPFDQAAGRVAGEMIAPYPPGIPAVCPGERITTEILDYLRCVRAAGGRFHGPADPKLCTIRVIA